MGGRPKALLAYDDRDTFVTRIIRTFAEAGVHDIVVVVGHEAPQVIAEVEASGLPARSVMNPSFAKGQLSSIVAGIDAIDRTGADAMLLALVDAPAFTASTVKALVERFEASRAPVVRAVRGDKHGHPVLIASGLFAAIRQADPLLGGAKSIVRAHASADGDVTVEDPGAFVDVDTPADYQQLRERSSAR
jgi:CTP:molybdopterin cytidylyltransferase MocA